MADILDNGLSKVNRLLKGSTDIRIKISNEVIATAVIQAYCLILKSFISKKTGKIQTGLGIVQVGRRAETAMYSYKKKKLSPTIKSLFTSG